MDPDDLSPVSATLDTATLRLRSHSAGGLQAFDSSGYRIDGVVPQRLFPLTDPAHWIVLLDRQGREVGLIEEPRNLEPESAQVLELELKGREFVPLVSRILWVSGKSEPSQWRVATDRGVTEFVLKDEKDIRRMGARGVLIIDAHGIRYLIADERQLDRYSRRIIEWYIA
jgi:hypothetical protein